MRISARHGIAIAPILFIVALLAVLATAIAAGSGTFSSGSAQESARTMAQAIISQGLNYKTAVDRVLALGCRDVQVSFESPSIGLDYSNSNAPADYHCHVFRPEGGGAIYQLPPSAAKADDYTGGLIYRWSYSPACVPKIGQGADTNCWQDPANFEIVAFIPSVRRDVCIQINDLLGVANPSGAPPPAGVYTVFYDPLRFVGSFAAGSGGTVAAPETSGKMQGCAQQGTSGAAPFDGYYYYQVLLPR